MELPLYLVTLMVYSDNVSIILYRLRDITT